MYQRNLIDWKRSGHYLPCTIELERQAIEMVAIAPIRDAHEQQLEPVLRRDAESLPRLDDVGRRKLEIGRQTSGLSHCDDESFYAIDPLEHGLGRAPRRVEHSLFHLLRSHVEHPRVEILFARAASQHRQDLLRFSAIKHPFLCQGGARAKIHAQLPVADQVAFRQSRINFFKVQQALGQKLTHLSLQTEFLQEGQEPVALGVALCGP